MATAVGVFSMLAPLQVGIALGIFAIVVSIRRYVSLGSIIAVGAFPVLFYVMKHPPLPVVIGTGICAAIIIIKHHTNIQRLLRGTENQLGRKAERSSQ